MSVRRPPLYHHHEDHGASFTEFGGWEMPVEFEGIQTEHHAVREAVGRFDVSHMGQVRISGPDAAALTDRLLSAPVSDLAVGEAQYAGILTDAGHLIDDIIIYRQPAPATDRYLMIPNVGNDTTVAQRWRTYRDDWELDADIEVRTDDYVMYAIQGPAAPETVQSVTDIDVTALAPFEGRFGTIAETDVWISRTGYTGEDGFEIIGPQANATALWTAFDNAQACGLGARDTLRIEQGFLLSGQDFDPETQPVTPIEAGIGFAVDLDHEFIGRGACQQDQATGPDREFVGIMMLDRGIPRHGYEIRLPDGTEIGTVTSGTMSPTLDEPIGLGYVAAEHATVGTDIEVLIRDRPKRAQLHSHRFLEDQ